MIARATIVIDEIRKKHLNENIIIVCHGGIKYALLSVLYNKKISEISSWGRIKNTSVSIFETNENNQFVPVIFNCTKHLE